MDHSHGKTPKLYGHVAQSTYDKAMAMDDAAMRAALLKVAAEQSQSYSQNLIQTADDGGATYFLRWIDWMPLDMTDRKIVADIYSFQRKQKCFHQSLNDYALQLGLPRFRLAKRLRKLVDDGYLIKTDAGKSKTPDYQLDIAFCRWAAENEKAKRLERAEAEKAAEKARRDRAKTKRQHAE